jgi:hypothetical protein
MAELEKSSRIHATITAPASVFTDSMITLSETYNKNQTLRLQAICSGPTHHAHDSRKHDDADRLCRNRHILEGNKDNRSGKKNFIEDSTCSGFSARI